MVHAKMNVKSAAVRATRDYYPTPPAATAALLSKETFDGTIWEPCAGKGWMVQELKRHGYSVIGTDIADGKDVLTMGLLAPNVVTNPPYGHNGHAPDRKAAEKIAAYLLALGPSKLALLLPLQWYCSVGRSTGLFARFPVSRVWAFADRFAMWPDGKPQNNSKPPNNSAWFVWDKQSAGPTTLGHVRFNVNSD